VKVIQITPVKGEQVTTTEGNFEVYYERYAPDCWYRNYGNGSEAVYETKDLEESYQKFIKEQTHE
jgi:hypothetical protein